MEMGIFLLFLAVAALSLVFSLSALILLRIRKKTGKSVRATVWILLLVLAVVPLLLPARLIRLRLFTDFTGGMRIEFRGDGEDGDGAVFPDAYLTRGERRTAGDVLFLFLTLWTVAAAFSASFGISGYWDTLRFLTKNSEQCRDERALEVFRRAKEKAGVGRNVSLRVMHPDLSVSPCMCGTWSPSVFIGSGYLKDYPDEWLELLFLHELTHIRHHDGTLRLFTLLGTSFHALNPLSGAVRRAVCEDSEYLCDREVLRKAGKDVRRDYIRMILDIVERNLSGETAGDGLLSPASEAGEILMNRCRRMQTEGDSFVPRTLSAPAAALVLNLALFFLVGIENPDNLRLDLANPALADALLDHFDLTDPRDLTEAHLSEIWSLEFYHPRAEDDGAADPVYYCIVNEDAPERSDAGRPYPYTESGTDLSDLALFSDLRTVILEGSRWELPEEGEDGPGYAVIRRN
ncbi:MAG: M56 family metallopeptidase [Clostridia bacterium]|nr:M56 family metallopeptidase [Clostridia bacterium]